MRGRPSPGAYKTVAATVAAVHAFDLEAAAALPPNLRFGTSTWTYEDWKGSIYTRDYGSAAAFKRECLAEYAELPWFRTVGIDHSFYGPPTEATLDRYASQVPADFRWVSKVWKALTVPTREVTLADGRKVEEPSPDFLDPELFLREFLARYDRDGIREHTGPFIFEFGAFGRTTPAWRADFYARLDAFLAALPTSFQYATEIRTPALLEPAYFEVLNAHGATHCFNHWSWMPPLVDQMRASAAAGGLAAPFYVARLLTPLRTSYRDSVQRFKPYDSLKEPHEGMRRDVVRLALRAMARGADAWVLANNRMEGNSPQTIEAIGKRIIERLRREGGD